MQPLLARLIPILFCVCFLLTNARSDIPAPAQQRRILVVNSESMLLPVVADMNQGLFQALKQQLGSRTEIFAEWLDLNRFGNPEHTERMAAMMERKYAGQKIDGVIAVTEGALRFVLRYRERLAGIQGAPIVHLAVRDANVPGINAENPGVYGAAVDYSPLPVLHWIDQAHPEAQRVVIVTGASPVDLVWEQYMKEQQALFKGRVRLEFWSRLAVSDLLPRLAALDGKSVVLTPSSNRDGAGEWMMGSEFMERIVRTCPRPVYCMWAMSGVRSGGMGASDPISVTSDLKRPVS